MKITNAKARAFLSILALILIAFFANWFFTLIPIGNRGLDLTEDKVHTISDGTKSILKELDANVTINYYATRKSTYLGKDLKLYMKKVDDFLRQYESLAKGKVRIEYLDPQPDTDAEDSANLDGISGQRLNDENIYFGLSVQCLDKKATIPFLNPNNETLLEYHISSAIAEVTESKKPVIGIISALPLEGSGMPQMPGQPPQPQEWVIHEQLANTYEIKDLGIEPETIDSNELSILLLIHPAGISPETEYKVDQFLLAGGTVVAAVDGFNLIASSSQPSQNPMMPQPTGGVLTGSTLPKLFEKWGVTFESNLTMADGKYRTEIQSGTAVSLLSMTSDALPAQEEIVTKGMHDLLFAFPGGFREIKETEGIETTVLVESSEEATFVDGNKASRLDPRLAYDMRPDGIKYPLVVRMAGEFETAFPDGNPAGEKSLSEQSEDAEKEKTEDTQETESASLVKSTEKGTVFLIADADMFHDQFAFRVQNMMGGRFAIPMGSNAALLQNIIDMSAGSKYLINSRSRASSRRPFTVIKEMEAAFEQEAGEKMQQLEEEQETVIARIQELQSQKQSGNQLLLNPQQQQEVAELREKQVEFSRQLRDLQKGLQKEKDKLSTKITLANVAVLPSAILLIGLIIYISRRSSSRAK